MIINIANKYEDFIEENHNRFISGNGVGPLQIVTSGGSLNDLNNDLYYKFIYENRYETGNIYFSAQINKK